VPLAMLIFGSRADLSLILLPIMFYHPFQLLVNGLLANQWASQRTTTNDGEQQKTWRTLTNWRIQKRFAKALRYSVPGERSKSVVR
jgi:hypothetical protein